MSKETFKSLLVRTEFPECLGMMYAGPDVFFIDIFLTISPDLSISPAELTAIVCQQVIVPDPYQLLHTLDDCLILLVPKRGSPAPPGMIIFHCENGYSIEVGQICLDQAVWMAPFKPLPLLLDPPLPIYLPLPD